MLDLQLSTMYAFNCSIKNRKLGVYTAYLWNGVWNARKLECSKPKLYTIDFTMFLENPQYSLPKPDFKNLNVNIYFSTSTDDVFFDIRKSDILRFWPTPNPL